MYSFAVFTLEKKKAQGTEPYFFAEKGIASAEKTHFLHPVVFLLQKTLNKVERISQILKRAECCALVKLAGTLFNSAHPIFNAVPPLPIATNTNTTFKFETGVLDFLKITSRNFLLQNIPGSNKIYQSLTELESLKPYVMYSYVTDDTVPLRVFYEPNEAHTVNNFVPLLITKPISKPSFGNCTGLIKISVRVRVISPKLKFLATPCG